MLSLTKRTPILIFSLLLYRSALSAQTATATISGSVLDGSGAAIQDATVQAENPETGARREVETSGAGVYAITTLAVGHYRVTVEKAGFQTHVLPDIELQVGQNRTVDAQLNVASVGTSVTVADSAAPLAATSAEVGGVVSGNQIREVPLNGRNWSSLMTQAPGAIDNGQNNQRSIRFAGRGLDDNNFRFDGVDATGIFNQEQKGTFRLQFSTESIAEFRARAALYTAESGGTEGGQVDVVSRSGTNTFHGSAFEYLRNDFFDARGPFDGSTLPPFRLNQFGGSFGGPVRKDKDFFFATYEGLRQRIGQTLIGFVPSAAFRARAAAVSPAIAPFLLAFPAGTSATTNPDVDRRAGSGSQITNEDFGMFRYDHRFSDRVSLFVRYNLDVGLSDVPNGVLTDCIATTNDMHNAVAGLTTVLSSRTINEFRIGFNRANFITQNESVSPLGLTVPQFSTLNDATGKIQASNSFDYLDSISTVRGRHTLKAGMEIRRVQINSTATAGNDYIFGYASASDFQNNALTQASLVNTLPVTGLRRTEYFGYVQDEFRITRNLTADLGARYEYFGVPHEVKNRGIVFDPLSCPGGYCPAGSSFYEPDYNNLSPRVSLAWNPAGLSRTVIRAGYGIYYGDGQIGDLNAPADNLSGRALLTSKSFPSLSFPIAPALLAGNFSLNNPRGLDRHRRTPYTQDWGLSVQQALSSKTVATLGYLGTKGTHQFTRTYLNTADPVTGLVAYPSLSIIDYKTTSSNSTFHGLQASVQRNLSSSVIASLNYLYSHSINDGSTGGGETTAAQNVRCRACERASSDQDVRSYLSGNFIYQLPFGKGRAFLNGSGFASRVLGGWQWMNVFTARSGLPVNVSIVRTAAAVPDGNTLSTQRPNVVSGSSIVPATQTVNSYVSAAAFATPAAKTFGNAGRNLARGPDLWQLDTALSKSVPIIERMNLVFRAEAFNLFNRAQFGTPNSNLSSLVNFGQITTTVNPTGIGTGTPRELQLALRLEF